MHPAPRLKPRGRAAVPARPSPAAPTSGSPHLPCPVPGAWLSRSVSANDEKLGDRLAPARCEPAEVHAGSDGLSARIPAIPLPFMKARRKRSISEAAHQPSHDIMDREPDGRDRTGPRTARISRPRGRAFLAVANGGQECLDAAGRGAMRDGIQNHEARRLRVARQVQRFSVREVLDRTGSGRGGAGIRLAENARMPHASSRQTGAFDAELRGRRVAFANQVRRRPPLARADLQANRGAA